MGLYPRARALSSDINSIKEAPSDKGAELPSVTVPNSLSNIGGRPDSASELISYLTQLSAETISVKSGGTNVWIISSSKIPSACALEARVWLLTAKELAQVVRLDDEDEKKAIRAIYEQVRRGNIPVLHIGKHLRFDPIEVGKALRKRRGK